MTHSKSGPPKDVADKNGLTLYKLSRVREGRATVYVLSGYRLYKNNNKTIQDKDLYKKEPEIKVEVKLSGGTMSQNVTRVVTEIFSNCVFRLIDDENHNWELAQIFHVGKLIAIVERKDGI